MKYLFSITVPVLLLFFAAGYSQNIEEATAYTHPTFTEFHHECSASSAIGSTCSGTCTDACSCTCSSGFMSCSCECKCGTGSTTTKPTERHLSIPSEDRWISILEVVASEDTKHAKNVYKDIKKLHQFGKAKDIDSFEVLSSKLDKDLMLLQPATLENLILAIS